MPDLLQALFELPDAKLKRLVKAKRWFKERNRLTEEVDDLERRLARAKRQLAKAERRLNSITDGNGVRSRAKRAASRKANRRSRKGALKYVLATALKKHGKSANVAELAKMALAAGYQTKSKSDVFQRAVAQALSTSKDVKRVGRGQYAAR